ncbi:MAG: hypothetical protein FVQ83_00650 [Chloroflexi bacterium]|nr:hypothetical protein [Chloroflexota bacterium]
MEANKEGNRSTSVQGLRENPLYLGGLAFLVGVIFGLVILGWWLWPKQYIGAAPWDLQPEWRVDYMRLVIDSYTFRPDRDLAEQRLGDLGEHGPEALAAVQADPKESDLATISLFLSWLNPDIAVNPTPGVVSPEVEGDSGGGLFSIRSILLWMCVLTVILGGGLVGVYFFRTQRGQRNPTAVMQAQELSRQAQVTDFVALGEAPPIAQWMTTYLINDNLFDDSFSIDTPSGEFMGECGVGIADTIGVGDPKRVSAFEIWLFDKNDIQTVTRVVMSTHAFNDDAIRESLAAKGEPELAEPGKEVVLETETLQMVARVVDMAFGEGALPDDSFFDRITLELAVWTKI